MNVFKTPAEYAAILLDLTGGNKVQAVRSLFEAQDQYNLPRNYVADVFNIITGN